jgi:hypothetical protein
MNDLVQCGGGYFTHADVRDCPREEREAKEIGLDSPPEIHGGSDHAWVSDTNFHVLVIICEIQDHVLGLALWSESWEVRIHRSAPKTSTSGVFGRCTLMS